VETIIGLGPAPNMKISTKEQRGVIS